MRKLIVTIDGPSGAGKSTISRELARRLGYTYVDTGAIYRAVALAAREQEMRWDDTDHLELLLNQIKIEFHSMGGENRIFLNGRDVSEAIRQPEITRGASTISGHPVVREGLFEIQRSLGRQGGVVLEGRDIGTVVFPEAEAKFYLDASLEERARRRFEQLGPDSPLTLEEVHQRIKERDHADSTRDIAPLRCPHDALVIDSSPLSIEEVVEKMLKYIEQIQEDNGGRRQVFVGRGGLCPGIDQAVTRVIKRAESFRPGQHIALPVPLANNPQLLEWLRPYGVLSSIEKEEQKQSKGSTIVAIGTHGLEERHIKTLREQRQEFLDLTCSKVRRVHNLLHRMTREGYFVVFVADLSHPETQAALSYAVDAALCAVVQQLSDLEKVLPPRPERVAVLSQTAFLPRLYHQVIEELLEKDIAELRLFHTFCDTVMQRQEEARRLAREVERMVVVGGRISWNTNLLRTVCEEEGVETIHIETAQELDPSWFQGVLRVGVVSGTSTPDRILNEVVSRIRTIP